MKCISGEKDTNGIYKIIYQSMRDNDKLYAYENGKTDMTINIDKMIVTLQKKGNDYIFVSNNIYTSDKTVEVIENTNKLQTTNANKDNSVATKEIPKTGKNSVISIIIAFTIAMGMIGIMQLYKYRDIK